MLQNDKNMIYDYNKDPNVWNMVKSLGLTTNLMFQVIQFPKFNKGSNICLLVSTQYVYIVGKRIQTPLLCIVSFEILPIL